MPPASPVPGWSRGEVWTESMATRRGTVIGVTSAPSRPSATRRLPPCCLTLRATLADPPGFLAPNASRPTFSTGRTSRKEQDLGYGPGVRHRTAGGPALGAGGGRGRVRDLRSLGRRPLAGRGPEAGRVGGGDAGDDRTLGRAVRGRVRDLGRRPSGDRGARRYGAAGPVAGRRWPTGHRGGGGLGAAPGPLGPGLRDRGGPRGPRPRVGGGAERGLRRRAPGQRDIGRRHRAARHDPAAVS